MVNYNKVFAIEKKIARELLAQEHHSILVENRYIRDFRREIRQFFWGKVFKNDANTKLQQKSETIWQEWSKQVFLYRNNFIVYFSSVITNTDNNTNDILTKNILELQNLRESSEDDLLKMFYTPRDLNNLLIQQYLLRIWTTDDKNWQDRIEELLGELAKKEFTKIFIRGLKDGKGYREIVRQAKEKLAMDAVKLERIIRTEGQRIQNDVILHNYEKYKIALTGIEYTATLDTRTCLVCGAYDGKQYFYNPPPGGLSVSSAPILPIHPLCRCIYVPISKLWEEFGQEYPLFRASQFGPTTGKYADWLEEMETQLPGFAKGVLGKHYDRWIRGEWQLKSSNVRLTPQSTIADFLRDY